MLDAILEERVRVKNDFLAARTALKTTKLECVWAGYDWKVGENLS